jgi:hypothetical protein
VSTAAIAMPKNDELTLWRNQALAILRMELKRNFISKRGIWIYLLAFAPAVIVWLHSFAAMSNPMRMHHDLPKDTEILATLFPVFFLRPAMFFGCVGIFTYLFRGELVEKSLHYLFLSPVRREVQVLAKFVAGLITAWFFFGISILLMFSGMYAHFSSAEIREFLFNDGGINHAIAYFFITLLGCVGWGAVCLWMGIRWRNPIIPSVSFLLWESINTFLPSWLRPISVLHYLQSMVPVKGDFSDGAGALIGLTADPVPPYLAIPAIFLIAFGMLALSVRQLKKTEISYSSD